MEMTIDKAEGFIRGLKWFCHICPFVREERPVLEELTLAL